MFATVFVNTIIFTTFKKNKIEQIDELAANNLEIDEYISKIIQRNNVYCFSI